MYISIAYLVLLFCKNIDAHSTVSNQLAVNYFEFLDYEIGQFSNPKSKQIIMKINNFNSTIYLILNKLSFKINNLFNNHDEANLSLYDGSSYFNTTRIFVDHPNLKHKLLISDDGSNNNNWARITLTDNNEDYVQGMFYLNNVMYNIQPTNVYNELRNQNDKPALEVCSSDLENRNHIYRDMVIYRSIDTFDNNIKKELNKNIYSNYTLFRRDIDNPIAKCNPRPKRNILYMGVVADCHYVNKTKSRQQAIKNILSDFSSVSKLYESTFNLQVGIVSLEIMDKCDNSDNYLINKQCEANGYNLTNKLEDFAKWALRRDEDIALWHLLTDCFIREEAGIAFTNISFTNKDGKNVGVTTTTKMSWKTIAHEIGHNLGSIHDCTLSTCKNGFPEKCLPCDNKCDCNEKYIMNPSNSIGQTDNFSPKSVDLICQKLIGSSQYFDKLKKRRLLKQGICGNKIVENNEECDCGSEEECKENKCCTSNCKLKEGAQCDDTNDGCCSMCKIKQKGEICRKAGEECDVEEYCDGSSGKCPEDKFVENGQVCGSKNDLDLRCANGYCTSMDKQCQAMNSIKKMKGAQKSKNTLINTCQMICNDYNDQSYLFNENFIDGTQCGKNLFCEDGKCEGRFLDKIIDFINRNMAISIVILIGLILISLSFIVCVTKAIKAKFISKKINNRL